MIPATDGARVPLSEIVEVRMKADPPVLCRVNGRRCVTLDIFADGLEEAHTIIERARSLAEERVRKSGASVQIEVRALAGSAG